MVNLNYAKYLNDKSFNYESEYKKIFLSKFEVMAKGNIRKEFIDSNSRNIFDNTQKKSLQDVFESFKDQGIDQFNILFKDKNLEEIFTLSPSEILNMLSIHGDKKHLSKLKYFFNYDKFQNEITEFFTENFSFRTCFYCNKDFIINFDAEKKVSTFQLDHFFDKGTYPYLALSVYNLIPSCSTCNSSKVKGSKNTFAHDNRVGTFKSEVCIAPNDENFDFDSKVKFKLYLNSSSKHLDNIKSKNDIEIVLNEQFSDNYEKYIKLFKLNERYKAHNDIVYEMIEKSERYPDSRLKELEKLTGINFQQIKKDIFNLPDNNEDLSKQAFSKLIKDINEELGLMKSRVKDD